ncbi:hypothetical protein R6Q59_036953 [Mikania micrantha]
MVKEVGMGIINGKGVQGYVAKSIQRVGLSLVVMLEPTWMDGFRLHARKLSVFDHQLLDYDDAGANQRHDPRKGRGGGGGGRSP